MFQSSSALLSFTAETETAVSPRRPVRSSETTSRTTAIVPIRSSSHSSAHRSSPVGSVSIHTYAGSFEGAVPAPSPAVPHELLSAMGKAVAEAAEKVLARVFRRHRREVEDDIGRLAASFADLAGSFDALVKDRADEKEQLNGRCEKLVTPNHASKMTGIGAQTIRQAFDNGEIKGTRVGSHRKLSLSSVWEWADCQGRPSSNPPEQSPVDHSKPLGRAPRRFI